MAKVGQRLLLVLVLVGLAYSARPGDFKVLGPGGGGAMFNPTISPHDPNTVLISCDMTGLIPTTAGNRGECLIFAGWCVFFVFDPLDPRAMYAQATDYGEHRPDTWKLVPPSPPP